MSGRRRSSRAAAAVAAAASATAQGVGGEGAGAVGPSAPAVAAPAVAPAPIPATVSAPDINSSNHNDNDDDGDVAVVSSGGSTSPEAGAASSGSSSSGSSGGGGGGGGGNEAEEGSGRKRARSKGGISAHKPPAKMVHPNQESSDRWFTNTHIAMVSILAAVFNDLEERHSTTYGKDHAVDDAVLGFIQRIKDIGQGVTVFTISRLQTHSLISNTVQLCHRMAADQHTRLAKGYPSEEQVEYDVYDQSTDDGGGLSDDDEDDHDEGETNRRRGKKRALSQSADTKSQDSRTAGEEAAGDGGNRYAVGDRGGSQAPANPSAGKKPKRAAATAAAAAIAAGVVAAGTSLGAGGGGVDAEEEEEEEEEEEFEGVSSRKGKGKQAASRSDSSRGRGSTSGYGRGGAGVKNGVEDGAKGEARGRANAKHEVGEADERLMAACIVRQRYHAVVVKLAARAKWASEPVGRPRKDVITRAREVIMAIFIDSFYRRVLSLHKLISSLDQLDRMVAWADDAADNVNAKEAGALGLGLPMSEIGLTNIALTVPE